MIIRLAINLLRLYNLLCIAILLSVTCNAGNIDSLKTALVNAKEDTTKINLLNNLSKQLQIKGVYDTALYLAENAKNLAAKLDFKKGIAASYNNIGIIYEYQGNYPEALKKHFASLKINEETGNKKGIANSYTNIGLIYWYQGNYPEALKNHFASLKKAEEIGNQKGIADSYTNIGLIYMNQGNYSKDHQVERDSLFNLALKNYFASLKIMEEITQTKDPSYANTISNIGAIYFYQGNYPEVHQVERDSLFNLALKSYFASLKIRKETGNKKGIADSYNNIGAIYFYQGNYSKDHQVERDSLFNLALKNYFASLKIGEEIGYKASIVVSFLTRKIHKKSNITGRKALYLK